MLSSLSLKLNMAEAKLYKLVISKLK